MALFGFYIQKHSSLDSNFKNQYYCDVPTLNDASALAQTVFSFEKAIHTSAVTFDKLHIWVPNVTPRQFIDFNVTGNGDIPITGAVVGAVPVGRMNMNSTIGYGGYKDYRLHLGDEQLTGEFILGTYLDAINAAIASYEPLLGSLTTKSGSTFTDFTFEDKIRYRQLSKKWYNRATTP